MSLLNIFVFHCSYLNTFSHHLKSIISRGGYLDVRDYSSRYSSPPPSDAEDINASDGSHIAPFTLPLCLSRPTRGTSLIPLFNFSLSRLVLLPRRPLRRRPPFSSPPSSPSSSSSRLRCLCRRRLSPPTPSPLPLLPNSG